MVSNMIRAHLVNRDDQGWVDVLPCVMLACNEMEKGQHGYSTSQVMWGQGMNHPTDLTHGTENKKGQDQHQFVKNMGRELREIREKVRRFNRNKEKVATNPLRKGILSLSISNRWKEHRNYPPNVGALLRLIKYQITSRYTTRMREGRKSPMYSM